MGLICGLVRMGLICGLVRMGLICGLVDTSVSSWGQAGLFPHCLWSVYHHLLSHLCKPHDVLGRETRTHVSHKSEMDSMLHSMISSIVSSLSPLTHNGLVIVLIAGAHTHHHTHSALPVKIVLEQVSQLGVSVGNNLDGVAGLVVTESLHARSQHHQIGVDVVGLAKTVALALRASGALTASQVHQRQL